MRFSIVTPSFRNSNWLKLCIASVADQQVPHEHIVQDSCSDDGTQDWLPHDKRVSAFIEKDSGMYDAINRGWRRARGEFLSYLNCDEQYLPGTLQKVAGFFDEHPKVDVLFGDCIVVDPFGSYMCERRALVPHAWHTMVSGNLSFLTAGMFLRRRACEEKQLYFDPGLRAIGDAEWTLQLIKSGATMATLGSFVSAFTQTGHNLIQTPASAAEARAFIARAPKAAQLLAPAIVAGFRLRRLLAGHYSCKTGQYHIFTAKSPDARRVFNIENPTYRWRQWNPNLAAPHK